MLPRKKIAEITPFLTTDDVVVIHGARQTGKTTLLKLIAETLPPGSYFYFDLEDGRLLALCEQGPESIVGYLRQKGILGDQKRFFLQIDEIQYLSNPSNLLKLMHDHHPEIKLIVSGSSSFEMKSKFKDSLVGRTVDFELFPLDFEEFLLFRGHSINTENIPAIGPLTEELSGLYREFVLSGGYPKIALAETVAIKERYLQQIIDTYIKSDIRDLARVRHIDKFNRLLRLLAGQSGQLLNVAELSRTAQIAMQTVEEYLFILESTYVLRLVRPFSRNLRTELFRTPKVFFYDTGIMNMLASGSLPSEISGAGFETSVFGELVKSAGRERVNYWRTQDKKEIDFVLARGETISPIEVKLNAASFNPTAINYFAEKYDVQHGYCVSMSGVYSGKPGTVHIRPWETGIFKNTR